jgi:5-methylcytosine-specific restriction endonuclease McrA
VIARDGDRCAVTGCRTRGAATNVHHVKFWKNGGKTTIDNAVLLCPAHHHALHQGAFEITMIDGFPYLRTKADSWDDSAWRPASRNRLLTTSRT